MILLSVEHVPVTATMTVDKHQFCDLGSDLWQNGVVAANQVKEATGSDPKTKKGQRSNWDEVFDFNDGDDKYMVMYKTILIAVNSTDQICTGRTVHIDILLQRAVVDGRAEVWLEIGRPSHDQPRFLVRAIN